MRFWHVARSQTTCGRCGASILKGVPVQLISQIGLTRVLRRCQACAEGTMDPEQVRSLHRSEAPANSVRLGEGPPSQRVHEWTAVGELARAMGRRR